MDSFYKWRIVEKGRQVLYFKYESATSQDQVDDVKLILYSMLPIIALSSINYIYIKKTVTVMELLYTLLLHFLNRTIYPYFFSMDFSLIAI